MSEYDVVVAGAGVNGLACAALLTKEGLSVCVVERNPWVGGGAVTREVTLPGFKHDMFGSSHVWLQLNKDYKTHLEPELEKYGLKYIYPNDAITGHPDKNGGPGIVIYKSIDKTCDSIAAYSKKDAARYRAIYDDFSLIKDGVIKSFFSPPQSPSAMARAMENSIDGLRRMQEFSLSARAWVDFNFEHDFVKAVMLNWALAPQILPEQEGAGQSFYVMIPAIHDFGQGIPEGGSQELPNAMVRYLKDNGSDVMTGVTVDKFIVENDEIRGLRLEDGTQLRAKRAVVSALDPKQSFLKLTDEEHLQEDFLQMVRRYSFGKVSIARMHLALTEPPAFLNGTQMSSCPFHRIVDSTEQMINYYAELSMGKPTDRSVFVVGLLDLIGSNTGAGGKPYIDFRHICLQLVGGWTNMGRYKG